MDSKINVCLLNDSFPPTIDGVSNTTFNYADVLNKLGNKVVVATPNLPGVVDDYAFSVVRYPSLNIKKIEHCRTGIPISFAATRDILSSSPHILHTHCPFVSTLYGRALRKLSGAPMILTYHTKFDIDIAKRFESPLARSAAIKIVVENTEACDEVWTVSNGAGDNLKSLGFKGKFRVMENGVDFPYGRAADNSVQALNSEYDLPDGVPVFLFIGRMLWYKGLRITLDGLAKAKAHGIDFRMIFIGGGVDFNEVKAYAQTIGLAGECIFTGAVYDREKLRAFCTRADMFLFPSTYDTNGIVVRESAACSLGSVLIRGSCAAEDVTDGENGLLIDENADSMCDAIMCINADIGLARRIGVNAGKTLYISWETAVHKANSRYLELLEERRQISKHAAGT